MTPSAFRFPRIAPLAVLTALASLAANSALAQPVTGPYIAGEGGVGYNQDQPVRASPGFPPGKDRYDYGITGIGSLGWGLGNGFRVEVEGNYRNNRLSAFQTGKFPSSPSGRQTGYGGMANALFDMDIGKSWIYPYFGAGVGYGWQSMRAGVNVANSGPYQTIRGRDGNFAYQGIFGLAFPIPWVVGLSATTEYRFYSLLGANRHSATYVGQNASDGLSSATLSGTRETRTDYSHSLMLGLRYEFTPAPPPPLPAPAVSLPPAPAPARTYLVFFDWDSATLSSRAQAVVAEAAKASGATQVTHIQVSGYTDNSAARPGAAGAKYNLALSNRRASAVKAELIRDGIAAGLITTQGFGEASPLVATGPNTREPQNRRVEIDLK